VWEIGIPVHCLRMTLMLPRAAGATPILVTPMHLRTFGPDGKLRDILRPYAEAMKAVAAEKKVAVIDLHATSGELFRKLGPAGSAALASKAGDQTHFNEQGARAMAQLVLKTLPRAEPRLANELKPR
jgi:lysophospholipase L1-like esterase